MPLIDDFTFGVPEHQLPEPNMCPDLLADMFATTCPPPIPGTRNESDMGSVFSLGDTTMTDSPVGCTCISNVFSFFSTHPMLTGTHPAPIDACLVQGRESINVCERILSCVSSSRHHYRPLITVALFIDRIVAIYDRARQHYHQTLMAPSCPNPYNGAPLSATTSASAASVPPPPGGTGGPSTGGSSSPTQTWSLPQTPSAWMDLSKEYPFQTRPESSSSGTRGGSAFIGDYQLDKDDDVKMTIEIVFGHLSKVSNLIALFKSAVSRDDLVHMGFSTVDVPTPPTSSSGMESSGHDSQAFVCLRLMDLIEQQLNVTRRGWELICKEWEFS
ncbi:uncharacterized protein BDV14DRAFT_202280 [Aspergillus stella-maris]|uniref:uncharacterized protein n=1 Tax=Aspergillus stella-maris TaxID=1810926 RepID=UPI003CCCF071